MFPGPPPASHPFPAGLPEGAPGTWGLSSNKGVASSSSCSASVTSVTRGRALLADGSSEGALLAHSAPCWPGHRQLSRFARKSSTMGSSHSAIRVASGKCFSFHACGLAKHNSHLFQDTISNQKGDGWVGVGMVPRGWGRGGEGEAGYCRVVLVGVSAQCNQMLFYKPHIQILSGRVSLQRVGSNALFLAKAIHVVWFGSQRLHFLGPTKSRSSLQWVMLLLWHFEWTLLRLGIRADSEGLKRRDSASLPSSSVFRVLEVFHHGETRTFPTLISWTPVHTGSHGAQVLVNQQLAVYRCALGTSEDHCALEITSSGERALCRHQREAGRSSVMRLVMATGWSMATQAGNLPDDFHSFSCGCSLCAET